MEGAHNKDDILKKGHQNIVKVGEGRYIYKDGNLGKVLRKRIREKTFYTKPSR